MLCILLALMFAANSLSGALDRIQHAPGATAQHEHLVFGMFSAVADHDADHHEPQPDRDEPADHMMGGHHHHVDSGSGLLALSSPTVLSASTAETAYSAEGSDPPPRLNSSGPERPPKASHILA
jgi:hypothetical protein